MKRSTLRNPDETICKLANRKTRWILAATVAVVGVSGVTASAQQRLGNDGRTMDANNRIGSGGFNGGSLGTTQYGTANNAITYGNVTGGREFRGSVTSDPFAFRGATASGNSDSFIRGSSSVAASGQASYNANVVRPFYGDSRAVAPPVGFVQQGFGTGAFVPAATVGARAAGDFRLGAPLNTGTTINTPLPGQMFLPGPVDPNTQASTVLSASPLWGLKPISPSNTSASDPTAGVNSRGGLVQNAAVDRSLSNPAIAQMRSEISSSDLNSGLNSGVNNTSLGNLRTQQQPLGSSVDDLAQPDLNNADAPVGGAQSGLNSNTGGQNLDARLTTPYGTPGSAALQNNRLRDSTASAALTANVDTQQGVRQRVLNAPQQRISTVQQELQDRMKKYRATQNSPEITANQRYREDLLRRDTALQQEAARSADADRSTASGSGASGGGSSGGASGATGAGRATGGSGGTTVTPSLTERPGTGRPAPDGGAATATPPVATPGASFGSGGAGGGSGRPAPLLVDSFSKGITSQGLSTVIKDAENLMKAGKFTSSLDKFDIAEQVAPNNPLLLLGRANAELGATFYARSANHLRQSFLADKSLLLAQYDLRSLIGDERLAVITKDLKEVNRTEPKSPMPLFLLGYVAYNTGNERLAAGYIDLAEKRAGGDELYKVLRDHWSLPAGGNVEGELNK